MKSLINKAIAMVSGPVFESIALLFTRVALAGVFWRSARTKVEDGSLLTVSETALYQFSDDPFNRVPILNGDLGAYVTTYAEHGLAILIFLGLATRFGAAGLLVMTLVIQFFVFPDAWWGVHILWVAMALILITRGAGMFSLDKLIGPRLFKDA